MKTVWNLDGLYKSEKDPQIEKDLRSYEAEVKKFQKRYSKDRAWLESDKKVKHALEEFFALRGSSGFVKPYRFFSLRKTIGIQPDFSEKRLKAIEAKLIEAGNKLTFFKLCLGGLSRERKKELLSSKELSSFRYHLKVLFEESKFQLGEDQEKLFNDLGMPARSMWTDGFERVRNQIIVKHNGKDYSLGDLSTRLLSERKQRTRAAMHEAVFSTLKEHAGFAEAELNAICRYKKVEDDWRGFKKPYSSTVLSYQNSEKVVENLVDTVSGSFGVSHDFFKLKKRILGVDELYYYDRSAPIGVIKRKFSLDGTVEVFRAVLSDIGGDYLDIFNRFFKDGQIDVYPRLGKRGGAFCWRQPEVPTVVMLNHTDDFMSATTLAHEMGHAFHSELSKVQPIQYEGYTTATAEVASTLFEGLMFEHLFTELSDGEKIIALHDRLNGLVSSIFRQIALFNFEIELHNSVREQGYLSHEEIASLLKRHMGSYLGKSVILEDRDGYNFVNWPHIRYFFYVYSYAFGDIVSASLSQHYQKTNDFSPIETFLKSGGSESPYKIFKKAGIDIKNKSFFKEGLKQIRRDLDRLEKLL